MRIISTTSLILIMLFAQVAHAKKNFYEVIVADPYIELHTGPGRGYPIFHVIDRGTRIEVRKRRTDWYKVHAGDVSGWASARQLARTLEPGGQPARIEDPGRTDYLARSREFGIQLGDLDGANIISAYGAWLFTPNLSAELWGSRIAGDFSDGWMGTVNIVHQPFPQWRLSPFVTLGSGVIRIEPKSTLVATEDRTDQVAIVGAGIRAHVARRFLVRIEYKSYVAFTSRDDNEVLDEWKAGFSIFF